MGRERIVDIGVVLVAGLLGVTNALVQLPLFREPFDALAFGLLLAGAAALWFRRRAPVAVAWFVVALSVTLVLAVWLWPGVEPGLAPWRQLDPDGLLLPAAAPFAAYAVPVYARGHRLGWLPLAGTAVVAVAGAPPQAHLFTVAVQMVTMIAVPAVLGLYAAARANRIEREQVLRAEEATLAERLRLAAEIHEAVSHRVSVMVLRAGALQLTAADEPIRQAAAELRATGCQALDELRDLVGLLNTAGSAGAGPLAPMPDLTELLAAAESVGIAVDLHQEGEPLLDLIATLTEREREVLTCLGRGLSNADIARRLHLSPTTVKGHVSRILVKLDCPNRTRAGLLAQQAGLAFNGI